MRKKELLEHAKKELLEHAKKEWLEQGRALGKDLSDKGWAIGDWLRHGHAEFIGQAPNSKKGRRVFFANLRDRQKKLNEEAAAVTGLTSSTLRQYHAIARLIPPLERVKGLSFTHHLALAHLPRKVDEFGENACFDRSLAESILRQALDENWSVIKIRKHVRSLKKPVEPAAPPDAMRFFDDEFGPTPESRVKKALEELFKQLSPEMGFAVKEVLATYIKEVQESHLKELDELRESLSPAFVDY
jgi:hypothetical protein